MFFFCPQILLSKIEELFIKWDFLRLGHLQSLIVFEGLKHPNCSSLWKPTLELTICAIVYRVVNVSLVIDCLNSHLASLKVILSCQTQGEINTSITKHYYTTIEMYSCILFRSNCKREIFFMHGNVSCSMNSHKSWKLISWSLMTLMSLRYGSTT